MHHSKTLSLVGRCQRPHGLHGEIKLESFTRPPLAIFDYPSWHLQSGEPIELSSWRQAHKYLLVRFKGYEDIDAVAQLHHASIFAELPTPEAGSYYWKDLEGMTVFDAHQVLLGTVEGLTECSGHDLLIVKHGNSVVYVPFIQPDVITHVCPERKHISISWSQHDFHD